MSTAIMKGTKKLSRVPEIIIIYARSALSQISKANRKREKERKREKKCSKIQLLAIMHGGTLRRSGVVAVGTIVPFTIATTRCTYDSNVCVCARATKTRFFALKKQR